MENNKTNPSEIEKTNLEAHVMICSERFDNLTGRVEEIHNRLDKVSGDIGDVKTDLNKLTQDVGDAISKAKEELNNSITEISESIAKDKAMVRDNLLKWGVSIIISLIGFIGSLIFKYIPLVEKLVQNIKK